MRWKARVKLVTGAMVVLLAACSQSSAPSSDEKAVSSSPQPVRATVHVHGLSLDGMPLDLGGLKQLDLCTAARCYPTELNMAVAELTANDQGEAPLISTASMPPVRLTHVKLFAEGNFGMNATQVAFAEPVDLNQAADAPTQVLLSLSANRSCTRFACLALRGVTAMAGGGTGSYIFYNPNIALRRALPEQVSLDIPQGALPEAQIFRVNVSDGKPWPAVEIYPSVDLQRTATLVMGPNRGSEPAQKVEIRRTGVVRNAEAGELAQPLVPDQKLGEQTRPQLPAQEEAVMGFRPEQNPSAR